MAFSEFEEKRLTKVVGSFVDPGRTRSDVFD